MEPQRANRGALKTLSSNRLILPVGLTCLLGALLFAPLRFGFGQADKKTAAPAAKAGPGLSGILPEEVPDDLAFEAFEALGKDWEKWGEAVIADLSNLYDAEEGNADTQRKAIAAIRGRLKTAEAAVGDGSSKRDVQLTELAGAIRRRIDIAEAILDTLEADPKAARAKQVQAAWKSLAGALSALEADLDSYTNGGPWKRYVRIADIRKAIDAKNADAAELTAVARKIANRAKLSDTEQRAFLSGAGFVGLESALNELLRAAKTPPRTVNVAKLREALKTMVAALERYEATSSLTPAGIARKAFDAASAASADGGLALGDAMRTHYFNYNFRVYVSEAFVNRLIAEKRTQRKRIQGDRVMEARVYGNAVTTTRVGVDLLPSSRNARFDVTLTGATRSNTVGVTSQASIYTRGNHYFWARKEVRFDGESFRANRPARISVSANNTTTGARTKLSG
ncbi:MAG: hypothetical protein ACE5KM_04305, partial [Planctomycetaceae bacterium]